MHLKKILIGDDHPVTRIGLITVLKYQWPELEIIETNNGIEVIDHFITHKPDLLLIGFNLPHLNGFEVSERLMKSNKNVRIILFTMFDSLPIILNFLKIGGRGFLSKGSSLQEIIDAIYAVIRGDYYFHSQHEIEILAHLESGINNNLPKIKFTKRELEIIIKTSKGFTIKEISESMQLSERTVETYRYDLLSKAQVKNSNELIDFIYKNGISLPN
jgi:DNA-binding NarL/FixJ family response regulator